MSSVIPVTDSTFLEEVAGSATPVLVDFATDRCAPCRQLEPILESIAQEHAAALKIVRLDADAHPRATVAHDVQAVPTLILFVNGEPVKRLVGARGKQLLLEELADYL